MTARAVILAIDPGAKSGHATRAPSGLLSSGTVTTHEERLRVIVAAAAHAILCGLPVVVVAESWTRHGKWSHVTQAGISAGWGKWLAAIEVADLGGMAKLGRAAAYRGVARVSSDTWYRALIGPRRITANREERLRNAMRRAGCDDPDEAVARLISTWASLAPEVDAVLPVAFQRARSCTSSHAQRAD